MAEFIATALRTAKALIVPWEGMHKRGPDGLIHPYLCPAAVPTQGLGLVVASLNVPPITEAQAHQRFDAKLPHYLLAVLQLSPGLAAFPHRLGAMASFAFNCGVARYRASTLRRCIDAGDWEGAARELLRWVRAGGRVLRGLQLRRQAEAAVLLSNQPLTT